MVYILLVIGFACLIKGADIFVDGCSALARRFHVPSIVIGLTVVAMGTSLPECAISVSAALRGIDSMAISNITGSNIFNLIVVCGCCAVMAPLCVDESCIKKDMPLNIAATVLLLLLCAFTKNIGRVGGLILLAAFFIFLCTTVKTAMKGAADAPEDEYKDFSPVKCFLCLIGGGAAIAIGGQLVVESAEYIASGFGLSETLIGLTICAIGTSLPELVTSMTAIKKGEDDLAIGNVVGSCLFNTLLILGITAVIRPVSVLTENITDLFILIAISLMVLLMAIPKRRINRPCGAACLTVYAVYMVYICIR